jgi:hypothetical protein
VVNHSAVGRRGPGSGQVVVARHPFCKIREPRSCLEEYRHTSTDIGVDLDSVCSTIFEVTPTER